VATTWDAVRDQLAGRFPKVGPLRDTAKTEVLTFTAFPRARWSKLWSTNPLERVNKEIERRARVVAIVPHEAAVIRLVGAVLADLHDQWQAGDRRYLSDSSMGLLYPDRDTDRIAAINSGKLSTEAHTLKDHHSAGALPRTASLNRDGSRQTALTFQAAPSSGTGREEAGDTKRTRPWPLLRGRISASAVRPSLRHCTRGWHRCHRPLSVVSAQGTKGEASKHRARGADAGTAPRSVCAEHPG
jgi:hypothetical protein